MSNIPAAYRWLSHLSPLPRMVAEALRLMETAEILGAADSPVILGWARELGIADYRADATPWCGLFMAVVARRAGKEVPDKPLWAANWRRFGVAADQPMLGDVLVFTRPGGGGHVALYVGEDDAAFHVLGGNQGDRVCFTRIARARLRAARRPVYRITPGTVMPYRLRAQGGLSQDEG
jgi:uncharacterized protein (TIGR02594 family)